MRRTRLRKNWKFFETQRDRLARRHHGKFVVIYNEHIHAFEDTEFRAYHRAIDDGLPHGSFYIRHCVHKHEETPIRIRGARVNTL